MKRFITLLLLAPLTLAAPIAMADDDHQDVKLEDLPKPVRETVDREVKTGRITEIERETEHGKTFYEVEFVVNNQKVEIHVAPDGKLLARKTE